MTTTDHRSTRRLLLVTLLERTSVTDRQRCAFNRRFVCFGSSCNARRRLFC